MTPILNTMNAIFVRASLRAESLFVVQVNLARPFIIISALMNIPGLQIIMTVLNAKFL